MPTKSHKKSSGQASRRKSVSEVIADSRDEFEHLTVEAEDRHV